MDKLHLQRLAGINEDKWSGEVHTKKHPPEGLFANGTSKTIVKWLKDNHKEFKSAMSALNFYINRSGKNLTAERKAELESTKDDLRKAYKISQTNESLDLIRRLAGLPKLVHEKKDDEEGEEAPAPEETEEEIPSIVASIAKKAEGLTGDELIAMIQKVYDAGVEDGIASTKEEKVEESTIVEGTGFTVGKWYVLDDDKFKNAKSFYSGPFDTQGEAQAEFNKFSNKNGYSIISGEQALSKLKQIKESVKDSKGKEIKVGDKICWTDRSGTERIGTVEADSKYTGGMKVGGRSVKNIFDEEDKITVVN